jgi:hypothetical protein
MTVTRIPAPTRGKSSRASILHLKERIALLHARACTISFCLGMLGLSAHCLILAPVAATTSPHFSVSAFIIASASLGELTMISIP